MPSSVRPARDSSLRIRIAPEEVTLRDWPLVDRPLGSLAAIGLAAGLAWLAGWAADSAPLGGGLAVLLALTMWKTWLPARHELSGGGVTQSVLGWRRRIPWTAIQRCEVRRHGVVLFPDAAATPLSPLRGLYLHWGSQRTAVLAHLEYYVPSWVPPGIERRSTVRTR